MPPEMSRFSDRGNSLNQNAIEDILLGKRQYLSWEQRLYERGNDLSGLMYYKYPLELMTDMESRGQMGAMVFEIYDSDPQKLETRRNFVNLIGGSSSESLAKLKKIGESVASAVGLGGGETGEAQQSADQLRSQSPDPADTVGRGDQPKTIGGRISEGVNALAAAGQGALNVGIGALGVQSAGVIDPTKDFKRLQLNSMVEEGTSLGGGTSKVLHRIYLYIPNNIQADYGFEYETTNMSGMDVLLLFGAIVREGNAEAAQAIAKKIALGNLKIFESGLQTFGVGGDVNALQKKLEGFTRQVTNPMSVHLFKDVKRRSFSFSYTFIPKNEAEMRNCYAIINLFKYYSHPQTREKARFLEYPAEFQIKFYHPSANDGINAFLPYIFKCALTGIKVTYGEDSVMSTFKSNTSGAPPTKIKLDLTFDELEILTRDRFSLDPGVPNP